MSSKPLLAYVGHSHHRVTASSAFFLELLSRHFEVATIWDESWKPGAPPLLASAINVLQPDIVLFWQRLLSRCELRKLVCRRVFWAPMRDDVDGSARTWRRLHASGVRLINFCREAHEMFSRLGFISLYVQYWPPGQPANLDLSDAAPTGLKVFFWIRRQELGWGVLKALLGDTRPDQIVLRLAADPGEGLTLPSQDEIAEYRIELITTWLDQAQYSALLGDCDVFIAPRRVEGIGLSFLEAMAMGKAVVAPNCPTMNEYVDHGRNGYLYDPAAPAAIDFSGVAAVRRQALADVAQGHAAWLETQARIIDFLANPQVNRTSWGWRLRSWWARP